LSEDLRDKAFKDYNNGMKYKDIAEKYGVSLSGVKSWATRYWKKQGCNPAKRRIHREQERYRFPRV